MNIEKIAVGSIFVLVGTFTFLKRRINLENTNIFFTGINARVIGLVLIGIGICVLLFG
jgi:hypothetical protein